MKDTEKITRTNLAIYRPHDNTWFYPPVRHKIRNIKQPNKYRLLFDALVDSEINLTLVSSLEPAISLKAVAKRLKDRLELLAWCILNKISLRKIRIVFSKKGLQNEDYLLFIHYGNFTHEDERIAEKLFSVSGAFQDLKASKIVHLTHYLYQIELGAKSLEKLSPDILISENNLKQNSDFYKAYVNIDCQFLTLPFVAAERFDKRIEFQGRANKLVSTGSITYKIFDKAFTDFFKTNELQPLRRQLYEQSQIYEQEMDCLISDLNASRQLKPQRKRLIPLWMDQIAGYIKGYNPQKEYYSKDIVEVYNSYTMFVVPEEICGLPAIGFVEGMACGCAYFGLDDPMYRDLGLVPGKHYVPYDGSIEDLMSKVRYYQSNADDLESIAEQGRLYIINHFRPEIVYSKFIRALQTQKEKDE